MKSYLRELLSSSILMTLIFVLPSLSHAQQEDVPVDRDEVFLLEVLTDKDEYVLGDKIRVEIRLSNLTDKKICYYDGRRELVGPSPSLISEEYDINRWAVVGYYRGQGHTSLEYWTFVGPKETLSKQRIFIARRPGRALIRAALIGKRSYKFTRRRGEKEFKTKEMENAWVGHLSTEKTVLINDNPKHQQILAESIPLLSSEKPDERHAAIRQLGRLGWSSLDALWDALNYEVYLNNKDERALLIENIIKATIESVSVAFIKRLFDMCADYNEAIETRLKALDVYAQINENTYPISKKRIQFRNDQEMKSLYRSSLRRLLDDDNEEVKTKARETNDYLSTDWGVDMKESLEEKVPEQSPEEPQKEPKRLPDTGSSLQTDPNTVVSADNTQTEPKQVSKPSQPPKKVDKEADQPDGKTKDATPTNTPLIIALIGVGVFLLALILLLLLKPSKPTV